MIKSVKYPTRFFLPELIFNIAILGLLFALAVPAYRTFKAKAQSRPLVPDSGIHQQKSHK